MNILSKFRNSISKSSTFISSGINQVINNRIINDEILEQIEDLLIEADFGVDISKKLIHKIHQFNETKIKWYIDIYFIPLLLFILFLDQSTKFLVKNNLDLYQSWPSEGFFRITHGINTGIAFGLLENQSIILITILPIIAIVFLIYYYKKQVQSNRLIRIIFGLQLGGAFGSIIDRILLGSVVDFIDIGPWYIFNIADSSIVCGLILLIFFIVIQEQQYKNSTQSAQKK